MPSQDGEVGDTVRKLRGRQILLTKEAQLIDTTGQWRKRDKKVNNGAEVMMSNLYNIERFVAWQLPWSLSLINWHRLYDVKLGRGASNLCSIDVNSTTCIIF